MKIVFRTASLFAAAAVLCHCGAPQPPQCHRVPFLSRAPADTLIAEAKGSWAVLSSASRKSEWPAAQAHYNTTVAKLFDQLRCGKGSWQERAVGLGTQIF